MTVTRRALASVLRAQQQQAARSAVLSNAAARDAKGAVAVVEAQVELVSGEIPADLVATLNNLDERLTALE